MSPHAHAGAKVQNEVEARGGATTAFARWLAEMAHVSLSEGLAHECRRTILNALGVAIGAARHPGIDTLVRTARRLDGTGPVPIPGRTERLTAAWAAQVVGMAAHLEDFDDTHLATVIHPGAATLAALWSLQDLTPRRSPRVGERQLIAAAGGVEAQLRVGMAMTPQHYDAGWHITGTCGVIGAAVTAGFLLGSDGPQVASAVGAAASMTVGHREAFGSMVKPLHPGKAAANGVLAALLVREGFTASQKVLEAPRGFFGVLSAGAWDESWLESPVTEADWLLLDNTYKPFPCGIVSHPAIEAALAVRSGLSEDERAAVQAVEVACNPLVPELMGKTDPLTGLQAKFSTTHLVAAALADGHVGIPQVSDERANAPDLVALRRLVRLAPDPRVGRDGATVVVTLADGSARSATIEAAAGSLARPLSDHDLEEKFRALSEEVIGSEQTARTIDAVWSLGATTELGDVARACVPPNSAAATDPSDT